MHFYNLAYKKFTYTFFILFAITSCTSKTDENFRHKFYYNFIDFEKSEQSAKLLKELWVQFDKNDYLVDANNQFISIRQDTLVEKEFLNSYHPIIHRVVRFKEHKKYTDGEVRIDIINRTSVESNIPKIQMVRYIFTNKDEWILKLDLGEEDIFGLPTDSLLRIRFIAEEIARVSFK